MTKNFIIICGMIGVLELLCVQQVRKLQVSRCHLESFWEDTQKSIERVKELVQKIREIEVEPLQVGKEELQQVMSNYFRVRLTPWMCCEYNCQVELITDFPYPKFHSTYVCRCHLNFYGLVPEIKAFIGTLQQKALPVWIKSLDIQRGGDDNRLFKVDILCDCLVKRG